MVFSQQHGSHISPDKAEWDVIVIGAGMGGSTIGYALARAGLRVLFVEKGMFTLDTSLAISGRRPEDVQDMVTLSPEECRAVLLRSGRNADWLDDVSGNRRSSFIAEIGCGVGGSSALYGMALERFLPADFSPGAVHGTTPSALPELWPITYEELRPWYIAAEQMYRVHGTADPLRPHDNFDHLLQAPPLSPANADLAGHLARKGLHPYRLHMACAYTAGCECCQGYICPRECKSHAGRTCLLPAIRIHGATLITECAALGFEATRTTVTCLHCHWKGLPLRLRARMYVLSAGALMTPSILLNSSSAYWPNGLANSSDHVGRNLMRHLVDLYLIPCPDSPVPEWKSKELAVTDFYHVGQGRKYGAVLSFGELPAFNYLVNRPPLNLRRRLFRAGKAWLSPLWDRFRTRRLALAGILEDLPYAGNRVLRPLTAHGCFRVRFEYCVHPCDRERLREFRRLVKTSLSDRRVVTLRGAHLNKVIDHACGTCRFGNDPRSAVLDRMNRTHELDNLYICDASFFPSSAGMPPALTVAANALRVGAHLVDRL